MHLEETIPLLACFSSGLLIGFVVLLTIQKLRLRSFHLISKKILQTAEQSALAIKHNAELEIKKNFQQQAKDFEAHYQKETRKLSEEKACLRQKEEQLEHRLSLLEKKILDHERKEAVFLNSYEQLQDEKEKLKEKNLSVNQELEKISGFSANEAKELLFEKLNSEVKMDAAKIIRKTLIEAEEEAERRASSIIATAINRLAVSCVSESTVTTVNLPNDEMKGRIIGRDGRNIRTLEQATGINFVIDDTPNAVVLSGFDPLRIHIAKLTLNELIKDGRIHPTRIEEVVEKAKLLAKKQVKNFGEDAAIRAGVMNLHPEIIILLGKLKFRHSFGQNVLEHSLEVAHIMGLMAAELGIDSDKARRIGLLHDIGKAVSHEVPGTHALIGHRIALECNESADVANGIGCHHFEMEPTSIEASLCSSADAISASRLGARVEAFEEYIKRSRKLEEIAHQYPEVDKAYVLQAGRELRIFVLPEQINDDGMITLARDLTKKIETDINYGGKIKISICRETRIVEYAM